MYRSVYYLEDFEGYCPDKESSVRLAWWNQAVEYFVCAYYGELGYDGYTNFEGITSVQNFVSAEGTDREYIRTHFLYLHLCHVKDHLSLFLSQRVLVL